MKRKITQNTRKTHRKDKKCVEINKIGKKTVKYLEIKIDVNKEALEMLEAELLGAGFDELMINDPADVSDIIEHKELYKYDYIDDDLSNDLERNPVITIYLQDDIENNADLEKIKKVAEKFEKVKIEESHVDDQDWLYKWQEYFKPTKISDKIVVKPTWESYEAKPDELLIEIDPGMAFGTGTHETTSMCVKALEKYVKESDSVLDVGCGSGILSIVAARLGAKATLGIEIDQEAVEIAKGNIELNKLSSSVMVQQGDLTRGIDFTADIVVANLMADLVMALTPDVNKHLKLGGIYVSSGILNEKEKIVSEAIEKSGFKIIEVMHDGDWCAIIARR